MHVLHWVKRLCRNFFKGKSRQMRSTQLKKLVDQIENRYLSFKFKGIILSPKTLALFRHSVEQLSQYLEK
jgi:hypothetical protein